jgi:hypothetical protein
MDHCPKMLGSVIECGLNAYKGRRASANTRTLTTHGTRILAKVAGIVETYFHFAWRVGVVGVLWRSRHAVSKRVAHSNGERRRITWQRRSL